ncbi:MAG: hypothetical protein CVT77_15750 [Alphaproteobacteria bacterium HGW-Alphaproteobacteria-16]|nr:MAG: hypothetical protein CVT77_15750 [Alphaproteobacteria bacterium HGW-Alphaproteobacteria-16]
MRIDEQLRDRGPQAPVRPGGDMGAVGLLLTAVVLGCLTWGVYTWVRAQLPPPTDVKLANQKAQAINSPATWVTADDYPTAARRNDEQGAVGVALTIDRRGRVAICTVTSPSGSNLLDDQTCALMYKRAKYSPARDAAGAPVPSTTRLRFRWQLED